jgi:hypothetical protein
MLDEAYRRGAARAEAEFEKEAIFGLLARGAQIGGRAMAAGKNPLKAFGKTVRSGWRKGHRSAFGQGNMMGPARTSAAGRGLRGAGWLMGMSGKGSMMVGMPTGMALFGAATAEEGKRMQGAMTGALAGLGGAAGMKALEKVGPGAAKFLGSRIGATGTGQKAWKSLGNLGKIEGQALSKGQQYASSLGKGALGATGLGAGFYGFMKGEELGSGLGAHLYDRQAQRLPQPFNPVRGY